MAIFITPPASLPAASIRSGTQSKGADDLHIPSKEEFNISQQDNGDVDGDVFFVCEVY